MIPAVRLIRISKRKVNDYSAEFDKLIGFEKGGIWMSSFLNKNADQNGNRFLAAGLIKYGLSVLGLIIPFLYFDIYDIRLYVSSYVLFYLIEVQFLFIFPVIIENRKPVFVNNLKLVYSMGLFKCLVNTMVLGIYMIAGLLRIDKPYYNWYIGCCAIAIWYNENKYRLQEIRC